MTLSEKASYIKGLVEGFDLDKDKKENKALLAIVDLLEDISSATLDLENRMDDAIDQVEDMADDMEEIEKIICHCHGDSCDSNSDDSSSEDMFYDVLCPYCNTTVCLPESKIVDDGFSCPNCGQEIKVELDDFDSDDHSETHSERGTSDDSENSRNG